MSDAAKVEIRLTREFLLSGVLPGLMAQLNPGIKVLSDAERAASLGAMLDVRPEQGQGVWVFAYGSLIWNPMIEYGARRMARVPGWRRAFCLKVRSGRGSPENPGLMLGLMPGGACTGVAFHIDEALVEQELDLIWRREMVAEGYIPRWVPLLDETGAAYAHGIAFTINPRGPSYCGDLPLDEQIERIATAAGGLGTAAEYLLRTRDGLREMGIEDAFVEDLSRHVEAHPALMK